MHMSDALISPVTGGIMWVATAGAVAYSAKKVQADIDEKKIPLMGVMGAFVFAAQMINFSIPATGSSGHLGGGLLLSALLGPYAGFLTMASILVIQALFFADGGLLALGCNIFNLGFYTCFIAYPLIYRQIVRKGYSTARILCASMVSAIIGLQLGAFSVVLETLFSGRTELPFGTFLLFMQPIHLAIGVVEGLVTAAIIVFVWKARPEILEHAATGAKLGHISIKRVLAVLSIVAVITGGVFSWFASTYPDGLEWSISRVAGEEELKTQDGIHRAIAALQDKIAILPDYGFREKAQDAESSTPESEAGAVWPNVNSGASVSALVGGAMTVFLAMVAGFCIHVFKKRKKADPV